VTEHDRQNNPVLTLVANDK